MSAFCFRAAILVLAVSLFSGTTVAQQPATPDAPQQNSTRKIRVVPDSLASKAGTAIQWETDYNVALEKSAMSGRPIFWYVPTLNGTFMDRLPVIDRYMLAGPFSWPAIVNLINTKFVPLRMVPKGALPEKFQLQTYEFVEPGFVIVSDQGETVAKVDRLTTLHPEWLFQLIRVNSDEVKSWSEMTGNSNRELLDAAWKSVAENNWTTALPDASAVDESLQMELELLRGMKQFRSGEHQQARETWHNASRRFPDHPLGWKAAAEAQGIGPFVRGFEVFGALSDRARRAGVESAGSAAPSGSFTESELWQNSVAYLTGMQGSNGGFFDSDYDFGGADSLGNVHCSVTALCGMALLRARDEIGDVGAQKQIQSALDRCAAFCMNDENVNSVDRDEVLWAEAYRLRFALELAAANGAKKYTDDIKRIASRLENLQMASGSWFHEYPNSFVTATALLVLADAHDAGFAVDQAKVESGLKRLAGQRFPNGAYPYGTRREGQQDQRRVEPVPASAGRMPLCELARYRWKGVTADDLAGAVATGLEHHELLAKALKYDNHTSTYAYGGFFFWYDMQARSEAIAAIPDGETRRKLAEQQHALIMSLPELDGCFVDSHELGRCYGTAMALISLSDLKRALKAE